MSKRLFYKHFSQLFLGGVSAQLVNLFSYPFLTRMYSPSEYGIFTILSTLSIMFGGISCGTFDYAIQASKSYETNTIYNIAKIFNIVSSFFFLLFALIVGAIFQKSLYTILVLSASVYLVGSGNALMYFLLKNEKYNQYSYTVILKVLITVLSQIAFYFYFKNSFLGLLYGFFLGYVFQIVYLYKLKFKFKRYNRSLKKIIFCYRKYNKFLRINLPSNILNSISINGLNYALFIVFGAKDAGIYSMANRIVGLPLALISTSLSQVFFQKASKAYNETGTFYAQVKYSLAASSLSLMLVGSAIFIVEKWCIGYYLGEQWIGSSFVLLLLMPVFFGRFLCSNLTTIPLIIKKPKFLLIFNVFLILSTFFPVFSETYFSLGFLKSIFLVSSLQFLIYFAFLIFLIVLSKETHNKSLMLIAGGIK